MEKFSWLHIFSKILNAFSASGSKILISSKTSLLEVKRSLINDDIFAVYPVIAINITKLITPAPQYSKKNDSSTPWFQPKVHEGPFINIIFLI
jgi:hypothetical protein